MLDGFNANYTCTKMKQMLKGSSWSAANSFVKSWHVIVFLVSVGGRGSTFSLWSSECRSRPQTTTQPPCQWQDLLDFTHQTNQRLLGKTKTQETSSPQTSVTRCQQKLELGKLKSVWRPLNDTDIVSQRRSRQVEAVVSSPCYDQRLFMVTTFAGASLKCLKNRSPHLWPVAWQPAPASCNGNHSGLRS